MAELDIDRIPPRKFPLTPGVIVIPREDHRFHVKSRTRLGVYHMVDLEGLYGHGTCSCENFTFERLKLLTEDWLDLRPPRLRRCWHIRAALEFRGDLCTRMMLQEETTNPPTTDQDYHLK